MSSRGRVPATLGVAASLVVGVAFSSAPLRAEDKPRYKLSFSREAAASACPDAAGLRAAVAAKLGYDPFADDAPRTLTVSFQRVPGEHRAQIELRDESGAVTGARKLKSAAATCGPLADDVAQAIAIVVDPLYLSPPPPPTSASSAAPVVSVVAPPTATVDEPDPPPPPPPPEEHVRGFVQAGSFALVGTSPGGLGLGFVLGLGLRPRERWSIAVEARYDLEGRTPARSGGEVSGGLLVGHLVPCLHGGPLLACAVGQAGAFFGRSDGIPEPQRRTTLYLAAGVRLAVEVPLVGRALSLRLGADVLVSATRTRLLLDSEEVWISAPLTGTLGLSLVGWVFP